MKNKTVSVLSLLLLALSGCAGMGKPEMPEDKYAKFAYAANLTQACEQAGYFQAEQMSTSIVVFGPLLNSWNYDNEKLLTLAKATPVSATKELCNKMWVDTLVLKKQQDQARQVQSQPTPVLVNPLRTTSCSRVGPQMLCSSF